MTPFGLLFMASLAALALGEPALLLPPFPCSSISGTPCRCPAGTDYAESLTTAVIGATAANVGDLTNDFFNTEWAGLSVLSVQGPDNYPGLSIRDLNITTPVGTYIFSERLNYRIEWPDGSFEQRSEQRGTIPYLSGNGSFAGHWLTFKGDRIFENQTLVRFSNYVCQTGHPIDFAAFHRGALSSAMDILEANGLMVGLSTPPTSVQLY